MALVTIQRSPSLTTAAENDEIDGAETQEEQDEEALDNQQRSINECYFTVKGAALVLPQNECMHVYRKNTSQNGGDIQQHLQSMFYLLRPEDTLKMAVKLESMHMGRTRYLVVVSCVGHQSTTEESCLLGIDCNDKATTGLVLPVWADTQITLDGDGGFSVSSSGRHHIFKPVSVQAMWSALQTLHKAGAKARLYNYYMGGLTHSWIDYYERRIESERSCLNEWHAMDDLESRRPLSPDSLRCRPERDTTERYIRGKLKEIMMSVDLDEVTSKYIRSRLEDDMNTDLHEYKSFIDQEMIVILGQMDAATEIFEYLYLGSEWNASNLEELQRNGVGHILNVTREIDNFFPGMFDYLNIRVYDEEGTELLKHWDKTFKFIEKAKRNGSKVLVHCKMGVSRSASVVIAYAMKAYDWNMQHALEFVKTKRTCIKPNGGFLKQLETYQGILDASKQRHNTLWRSKSETNLKSPLQDHNEQDSPPSPLPHDPYPYLDVPSASHRPKSWSPEDHIVNMLFPEKKLATDDEPDSPHPACLNAGLDPSAKVLLQAKNKHMLLPGRNGQSYSVSQNKALHLPIRPPLSTASSEERVTFCIGDGDDSPVYECRNPLYASEQSDETAVLTQVLPLARVSSVKDRINELETQAQLSDLRSARDRLDLPELKGLVLNLANQFESVSKPNTPSPIEELNGEAELRNATMSNSSPELRGVEYPVVSQTKAPPTRHQAVIVRPETWVDEEKNGWVLNGWQKQDGKGEAVELVKQQDQLLMKLRITSQNAPLDISTKNDSSDQADIWPLCPKAVRQMSSGSSSQVTSPVASVDEAYFAVTDVRSAVREIPSRESSLGSGCETKTPPVLGRKDDPFSAHLDRVFEHEERTQQGIAENMTDTPSRQSSFGSCDSAIVLQPYGTRESPSRQSSWSSVDSRGQTFLSRESSWGSVDCRHSSSVNGHAFAPYSTFRKPSTVSAPDSQYSSPGADPHAPPFLIDSTTVKRVKPKIEDSSRQMSLKRTNSFDSSLTTQELSPLSPKSPNPTASPVQRSHSLRTGDRTFESRQQLTNMKLHTAKPYRSPVDKDSPVTVVAKVATSPPPVLHCSSFPTLVEGVPVGCADSFVQPNVGKCPLSTVPNSRSALKLDFGALVNQPASPPSAEEPPNSPLANDETGVLPGTVQQKKQALEHRLATTPAKPPPSEDTAAKEHLQHIRDLGRVVCQLPSPEVDDATLGKVKRLTKELESKSGQLPARRSRLVILDQQGKEIEEAFDAKATNDCAVEAISPSSLVASSVPADTPCTEDEEKSVRLLVGKFEMKDTHRTRYHSENDADPRASVDNDCSSGARCSSGSPPPSARKFSFDLEGSQPKVGENPCLPWRGGPSATPAQLPDQSSSQPSSSNHNILSSSSPAVCVVMPQTHNPPSSAIKGIVVDASSMPPAAPTGGAPRKMRKLHGKSHPLAKLPQRHPNPVYNTM